MVDEQNTSSLPWIVPDDLFDETDYLNEELSADDSGEPAVNPSEQILINQKLQRKRKSKVSEPDEAINKKANSSPSEKKRTRVTGNVSIYI